MIENQLPELIQKVDKLQSELDSLHRDQVQMMSYLGYVEIDTNIDMRIMRLSGPYDKLFETFDGKIDKGENLIKIIYKFTNNTNIRPETNSEIEPKDFEFENLETAINRFINSERDDKSLEMLGETQDGEVFLLNWYIVKNGKYYKNYLKITPTNTIVKKLSQEHSKEIRDLKKNANDVYNLVSDGVMMLNINSKIIFMNDASKQFWINQENPLIKQTNLIGRFFKDVLVAEDPDNVKLMIDKNNEAMINKTPTNYKKIIKDKEASYSVNPIFDELNRLNGLIIITKFTSEITPIQTVNNSKIIIALKKISDENKELREKVNEAETNQNWLMKNSRQYQSTIKSIYSYVDNLPLPLAIYNFPDFKIELVNKQFESMVSMTRKDLIGKSDDQIFSREIYNEIENKLKNLKPLDEVKSLESDKLNIKQISILDTNNKSPLVIRIFIKFVDSY